MKTVVQEKCLQLMLAARVMGWLGEQQWLLPCWKCDSFSSTSFLVLLLQSHTERCLKHPGAVTGGSGGSWKGPLYLGGGSWVGKDLWRLPVPTSAQSSKQGRDLKAVPHWVLEPSKDGHAGPSCSTAFSHRENIHTVWSLQPSRCCRVAAQHCS